MSKGVRVIGPDRAQLRWEMVDLDSQLPDDHRARVVWAFVQGMERGELYDRIKARDEGRAAGHRSAGGAGGVAVCDHGGDRLGAGD